MFGVSPVLTLEQPHVLFTMNVPSKARDKFNNTNIGNNLKTSKK
jgi:hypothetical protein